MAFEVEDNGIGIPAEEQARIFEEFRQVDGSSERAYGGIGLGLALVKRLTALMAGRVELRSAVGVGSTFTLTLPVEGPGEEVVGESGTISRARPSATGAPATPTATIEEP